MKNFSLTIKSTNVKVGAIPVTNSHKDTCPDACQLKNNGCYASQGFLNTTWIKLTKGTTGGSYKKLIKGISQLPEGQLFRHNTAGDLVGKNDTIDAGALKELVEANRGKRGFGYTHYPMTKKSNRMAVKHANENGFTINLSANNLAQADEYKKLGVAPVVTILPSDFVGNSGVTPGGNKFVVCVAQQREGVTCASCQLCQKQRSVIVGFKSHGMQKNKVDFIAA